jgi:hypothetical protein
LKSGLSAPGYRMASFATFRIRCSLLDSWLQLLGALADGLTWTLNGAERNDSAGEGRSVAPSIEIN